jgi:putative redox protein
MEVTTHRGTGPLQQVIEIGPHRILTDVKPEFGGEDSGPEPHDILAAALAACTTLTVSLYAKRKGYPLDDETKARLTDIPNNCPVHKTLSGTIQITTEAI